MQKSKNIQKIIAGCRKKRPAQQKAFVREFADFLYAICLRYVGDREEARDFLQISLFKILDKIDSFDNSKGSIRSWISTITINTCISEMRKKRPHLLPIIDEALQAKSADISILDELNIEVIMNLIQNLPDIYRQVFNLVEVDGYSHQEVGDMLGIEAGSSRSRLARSKAILRQQILQLEKNESWVNQA